MLRGDAGLPVSRGFELNRTMKHCLYGGTLGGYHCLDAGLEVKMMESEATRGLLKANIHVEPESAVMFDH